MAALLLCCSATAQTVDEAWAATPAAQDTPWAQVNAAPVNPANSGSGNGSVTFYSKNIVVNHTAGTGLSRTVFVECPVGKNVSGGGSMKNLDGFSSGAYIEESRPKDNGWVYTIVYPGVSATLSITAWVGCQ
ncbi:hypothetical protein [Aeromonas caviae]|uniref:hypothetical protein n=1 Tax=Aeromonas caviae TaxID=648 RepID=UPI0029D6F253|nr:hypothetical protein [Aeromonas caviae]MDX7702033.1 hypothetical protein [Aeromonas caviae]